MKAYQLSHAGLDGLEIVELPSPAPGKGQVKVRVHAASLNYRDLMIATGKYGRGPLKSPLIPLSDGAGEIVDVGEGVTGFKPGDRVIGNFFQSWFDGPADPSKQARALGGAVDGVLAQEVVWEAAATVTVPKELTFEEAATLPCAGLTAWVGLKELGGIERGQRVLALGTGGVSVFALQIAKAMGCEVVVTSSSNRKLERAKALGADVLINYREDPKWGERTRELTGGEGVDHVLEVGGAATLQGSLAALKSGGHLTVVGMLGGDRADPETAKANDKGVRVDRVYVGSASHLRTFCAFVEERRLKPVVDRAFDFAAAREAYEALRDAEHFGKLVIRV